jgi:hypothetical protein
MTGFQAKLRMAVLALVFAKKKAVANFFFCLLLLFLRKQQLQKL